MLYLHFLHKNFVSQIYLIVVENTLNGPVYPCLLQLKQYIRGYGVFPSAFYVGIQTISMR